MKSAFFLMVYLVPGCCITMAQIVLIDQTQGQIGSSVVSQHFESSLSNYNCTGTDDFTVAAGEQWHIDSVKIFGEYATPSGSVTTGALLAITICEDSNGIPGPIVFTDTSASNADPDGDGSLEWYWNSPVVINPGTYWLVVAARKDYGANQTQWQWLRSNTAQGDTAMWQNPGGGFSLVPCPSWNEITYCSGGNAPGLSFQLFGCPSTPPVIYGLPSDTSFCANEEINIGITTNISNANFLWSDSTTGNILTTDTGGSFQVTVTDASTGCYAWGEVLIMAVDPPSIMLNDDTLCLGEVAEMEVDSCPACNLIWSTGAAGSVILVSDSGWYWAESEDTVTGCSYRDSAYIHMVQPVDLVFDGPLLLELCQGDSAELSVLNPFDIIQWSTGTAGPSTVLQDSGIYYVTVTDSHGCVQSDTIEVKIHPLPSPVIFDSFAAGDFLLMVTGFEGYLWSDGSTDSTLVTPGGVFSVTVTDAHGCEGVAQIEVALAVSDPMGQDHFVVYPNPATDVIMIGTAGSEVSIDLKTVDGRIILQSTQDTNPARIALNGLTNGTYLLGIRSSGIYENHLIIIQ